MLANAIRPSACSRTARTHILKHGIFALGVLVLLALPAQAAVHRSSADPEGSTYTDALNILYANGWHDVSDLKRTGNVIHAVAIDKNGQRTPVTVDLSAGTVVPA
jgi:hypothetical protein